MKVDLKFKLQYPLYLSVKITCNQVRYRAFAWINRQVYESILINGKLRDSGMMM